MDICIGCLSVFLSQSLAFGQVLKMRVPRYKRPYDASCSIQSCVVHVKNKG